MFVRDFLVLFYRWAQMQIEGWRAEMSGLESVLIGVIGG